MVHQPRQAAFKWCATGRAPIAPSAGRRDATQAGLSRGGAMSVAAEREVCETTWPFALIDCPYEFALPSGSQVMLTARTITARAGLRPGSRTRLALSPSAQRRSSRTWAIRRSPHGSGTGRSTLVSSGRPSSAPNRATSWHSAQRWRRSNRRAIATKHAGARSIPRQLAAAGSTPVCADQYVSLGRIPFAEVVSSRLRSRRACRSGGCRTGRRTCLCRRVP